MERWWLPTKLKGTITYEALEKSALDILSVKDYVANLNYNSLEGYELVEWIGKEWRRRLYLREHGRDQ